MSKTKYPALHLISGCGTEGTALDHLVQSYANFAALVHQQSVAMVLVCPTGSDSPARISPKVEQQRRPIRMKFVVK